MSLERRKEKYINIESKFLGELELLMPLFEVRSKNCGSQRTHLWHDIYPTNGLLLLNAIVLFWDERRCRFVIK